MFYFVLVLGLLVFALVCSIHGGNSRAARVVFLVSTSVVLVAVSAFRYETGGDFASNYRSFGRVARLSFEELRTEPEFGNALLKWLVSRFTGDPQWFFALAAVGFVASIAVFVYRFSSNVYLSMLLFVALGSYFTAHNITVQCIAVGLWLWSLPFLLGRRFIPYLAIVLLAAGIHASALILLPLYFLARLAVNWRVVGAYGLMGLALVVNYGSILNSVQAYIYGDYSETAYGTNPSDVAGLALPAILLGVALLSDRARSRCTDRSQGVKPGANQMFTHFALLSFLFSLLSVTDALIMSRIGLYFSIGYICLVPNAISSSRRELRPLAYYAAVVVALLFFAFRNAQGALTPTPYTPFWTY